jgi:hypothetical protein
LYIKVAFCKHANCLFFANEITDQENKNHVFKKLEHWLPWNYQATSAALSLAA